MKKAISILLVLVIALGMCMSLSACGSGTIKLTKENFYDYFDINIYLDRTEEFKGYYVNFDGIAYSQNVTLGSKGQLSGKVTAVSQNYSYSDLTIRVKITANCNMVSKAEFDTGDKWFTAIKTPITYETEIKVDLNVAGEGKIADTGYCTFPSHLLCAQGGSTASTIEIIEVTGTVTPLR